MTKKEEIKELEKWIKRKETRIKQDQKFIIDAKKRILLLKKGF